MWAWKDDAEAKQWHLFCERVKTPNKYVSESFWQRHNKCKTWLSPIEMAFFFITIFVDWIVMKCSVIKLNGYGSCIWVTFKMFIDWRKSKRNSREFSLKYKVVKKVFLKLTFVRRFRVGIQQKIARFNNFLKMSTHLIALMRLYTNSFQRTNNALATITCAMCMNRYEQTIY